MDISHLTALQAALSRETERLKRARTSQEQTLRQVWVKQLENEIEAEKRFLGLPPIDLHAFSDDELLKQLLE